MEAGERSGKRKSPAIRGDEANSSKRPRSSGEIGTPHVNDTTFSTDLAGVIEKIYMRNFMCHSSFEIVLNQRCNFIHGKNGSGKSAILTALVVGLGGKACATNRGSSLKDFIMKGKSSATIEITIRNVGEFAYKNDDYGDSIIVTRTLSSGTVQSGYKIKAENGRIISTKREELDKIVSALNIQVENPISVLNQDAARTFLNSSDPREKYVFYMKATHLEELFILLNAIILDKQKAAAIVKSRKEALGISKSEIAELQRRKEKLESVQSYRDKAVKLQNELQWAIAITEEKAAEALQDTLNLERAQHVEKQRYIENEAEEEQKMRHAIMELEQQLRDLLSTLSNSESEILGLKKEQRLKKENYLVKLNEYNTLDSKIIQKNESVQSLNKEIDRLQKMSGPEHAAKQAKIKEEIQQMESEISDIHHMIKTRKEYQRQLSAADYALKNDESRIRKEINDTRKEIDLKKRQIQDYKREKNNSLTVFGPWVPRVAQRIEEAWRNGKFVKKPRGPLGAFIKVKDASWIPTIESFIGSFLKVYCVDSSSDYRVLHKIFQDELGNGSNFPVIITSKFFEQVHDVSRNAVQTDAYSTIKDALIISDPVLENCLIDSREIETILLIPTDKEARFLMSNANMVPRNCKRALTKDGNTFFPVPNYRTYAGDNRPPRYLQVSIADVISHVENELETNQSQGKELEENLRTFHEKIKANAKELNATNDALEKLNAKYLSVQRKLSNLRNMEEFDSNSIGLMADELEETIQKLQEMQERKKSIDVECIRLKEEQDDAQRKIAAIKDTLIKITQNDRDPLERKIRKLNDDLERIISRTHSQRKKYEELQKNIMEMESQFQKQQAAAEKAVKHAARNCPRIDTERSPKAVERELNNCNAYMKTVESISGTFEEVNQSFNEKKLKYDQIVGDVSSIEDVIEKLEAGIKRRAVAYRNIQRLIRLRVRFLFQSLLFPRKFQGNINIDSTKKIIEIEVIPSVSAGAKRPVKDTKSLSGGERSFSTVCFIMALWDCIEPPFFFLDEFDVFMDKVNRRIILDTLLAHATQKTMRQFVFLTPLDLNNIEIGQNVTVHRLSDPRSSSNTQ